MIGGGAGLRLCEQLGDTVRVLAVSALDQHDRALEAGAQAFMRKPLDAAGVGVCGARPHRNERGRSDGEPRARPG